MFPEAKRSEAKKREVRPMIFFRNESIVSLHEPSFSGMHNAMDIAVRMPAEGPANVWKSKLHGITKGGA